MRGVGILVVTAFVLVCTAETSWEDLDGAIAMEELTQRQAMDRQELEDKQMTELAEFTEKLAARSVVVPGRALLAASAAAGETQSVASAAAGETRLGSGEGSTSNAAELIGDALRESAKKSSRRWRRKKEETANSSQPAASTAALTSADVKCRGNAQNQTQLKGTLDCETNPDSKGGKAKNKGSACLDNLSSGGYYRSTSSGRGQCRQFNSKGAFGSTTLKDLTSNQPRSGLVTKAFVAHPNQANRAVGVFGFKRVLCNKNGGQCATFKNAVCIKCPGRIFAKIYEGDATVEEKSKFIDCCVLGHKQYQVPPPRQNGKAMGITKEQLKAMKEPRDCPASMRGTGAFTARNDAAAGLKEAYKCSEYDADKARTLVSSA